MSEVPGSVPAMSNTRTGATDGPVPPAAPGADGPHQRLLREEVATALSAPVGPGLLAVLVDLAGRSLSARERCESVVAWRRLTAFCDAGRLDAIAALDREMLRPDQHPDHQPAHRSGSLRPAADEISAALAIAPAVADALADGVVDLAQARLISAITRDVEPATCERLQALAVRHAPRASVRQLRQLLEAEAERLQPGWAAQRAAVGRSERDVALGPSPLPGCRRLTLDLPALEAAAAWLCVNRVASSALAGGVDGDGRVETRTLAQLRADTATVLLTRPDGLLDDAGPGAAVRPAAETGTGAGTAPVATRRVALPPPERFASLAEVQVVVAADTLLGRSDLPAHVPGVGPLDADHARSLAGDARWRRLVADPLSGTLLDRGTTVYRPPPRLRGHVVTRDGTCTYPTCTVPAVLSQVDHTIAFGRAGPDAAPGTTSASNTGAACARHHHAKTHLGWSLEQPAPGRLTWTSPTGISYDRAPPPLVPGWDRRRSGRHDPVEDRGGAASHEQDRAARGGGYAPGTPCGRLPGTGRESS